MSLGLLILISNSYHFLNFQHYKDISLLFLGLSYYGFLYCQLHLNQKNVQRFVIFFSLRKKLTYVVTRDICPSACPLRRPSVVPSVRRAVRPSVQLSVGHLHVGITLERGSDRSTEPIDLKTGLNMGNQVIHL